jgi:hypothetical protein
MAAEDGSDNCQESCRNCLAETERRTVARASSSDNVQHLQARTNRVSGEMGMPYVPKPAVSKNK